MEKKQIIGVFGGAILLAILLVVISRATSSGGTGLVDTFISPKVGHIDVIVTSTGEIEAENSVEIKGPSTTNRRIRISDLEITELVEEGINVVKGDYIATLDRTEIENSYKDAQETLEERLQSYELTLLDSAVTLSNLRGSLKNALYSIEAAQIKLDQSEYEPPATVRENRRNVEKAQINYESSVQSYELSVKKQIRNINDAKERYEDQRQLVADYAKMLDQLVVYAPASGVVNYYKDRRGEKREVGSTVDNYDNVVAVLPDMSSLISRTYVNEIDVNSIKAGQDVIITVDALPGNRYGGKVVSVANVGEQLANADAKVFEVVVRFNEVDPKLRTSMTTGNRIYTGSYDDVMYIPLGCVNRDENNTPFVYLKNGTKQIVVLGEANDNNIIVEQGLKENDNVYLLPPDNLRKFRKFSGEELVSSVQ